MRYDCILLGVHVKKLCKVHGKSQYEIICSCRLEKKTMIASGIENTDFKETSLPSFLNYLSKMPC
jgi:hypothetical protein